jgi:hypothetical protein
MLTNMTLSGSVLFRIALVAISISPYLSCLKKIVILKLEFQKAFDKVQHQVILAMMQKKGFSDKWLSWVHNILSSGTSQVLLNGVPGKTIHCRRGVHQGDPLSPLLFVLALDLLQSLVNAAFHKGIISLPLASSYGQPYPHCAICG